MGPTKRNNSSTGGSNALDKEGERGTVGDAQDGADRPKASTTGGREELRAWAIQTGDQLQEESEVW